MSENRRDAWRLTHKGVGWLAATGFRAACVIEDISVSGARVRMSNGWTSKGRPIPEELTLTTMLGGEQVTVPGAVLRLGRDREGLLLAIHFFNGDHFNLGWLINQAQREQINSGELITPGVYVGVVRGAEAS